MFYNLSAILISRIKHPRTKENGHSKLNQHWQPKYIQIELFTQTMNNREKTKNQKRHLLFFGLPTNNRQPNTKQPLNRPNNKQPYKRITVALEHHQSATRKKSVVHSCDRSTTVIVLDWNFVRKTSFDTRTITKRS